MKLKQNKLFIKFVIVGIVNTLIGTAVMFISYNLFGASYWLSSFLNYFIGSIVSYLLNKYYTFKQTEKSVGEVIKFIVNIAICYFTSYYLAAKLIQSLLAGYSTNILDNVSMLVGMVLFVVLNFIGQKYIVFKGKTKEKQKGKL